METNKRKALGKGLEQLFSNESLYVEPTPFVEPTKKLEEIVETTFKEVNKQNKDRLDYKVVNPSESETIEFVQKYGIQAIQYKSENQQKVAVGVHCSRALYRCDYAFQQFLGCKRANYRLEIRRHSSRIFPR